MATLTIITGASKGLGKQLALQCMKEGDTVATIERHPDTELVGIAKELGCELIQLPVNLTDLKSTVSTVSWLINQASPEQFSSVRLINNAGVLGPVGPISEASAPDIDHTIRINFEAPVLIIQRFLELTKNWKAPKRIMNISSGAARKDVPGWAMYCSTKAALDRFSSTVSEDAKIHGIDLKISSVAPGVVDTGMQEQIRSLSSEDFPQVERFKTLKEESKLTSPDKAAAKLLAYLDSPAFGQETITDIRNISFEG